MHLRHFNTTSRYPWLFSCPLFDLRLVPKAAAPVRSKVPCSPFAVRPSFNSPHSRKFVLARITRPRSPPRHLRSAGGRGSSSSSNDRIAASAAGAARPPPPRPSPAASAAARSYASSFDSTATSPAASNLCRCSASTGGPAAQPRASNRQRSRDSPASHRSSGRNSPVRQCPA
ncbi:hypothetical protein Mp_1g09780 [Marchantia polymorpha subsp. ruderalis]|uniref:Uncharacterized protein n=2 Tax=Marchantia polymorpha TaxID=3197 RepID=A0AAF6ANE0_MARPO|nr:hypothetical protein MARPO_0096s0023 [Marchantia polymorpha]BBM97960.1 hypothetical protein Mp_1g09780 [Marchantia polymorpha subsp. ruderalis]|eukprot:PTQ32670.1 hypothetical protein MARPO_0096s0023 [Marchantia polymorpha]